MNLPGAIVRTRSLDRWLRFNDDGSITVFTGKVEIGQGIGTAIATIAAEELDVLPERIRVQTADTELTPNEFITAGSMSIEDSGAAVRVASAVARDVLLAIAAEMLDVEQSSLTVEDGIVTSLDSNEQTDYWTLMGDRHFHVSIIAMPAVKTPAEHRLVGRKQPRIDLPGKLVGDASFVHDMVLPGMRHGRLVKPPTPGARLVSYPDALESVGLDIVRDGSFLGVVADREEEAIATAGKLTHGSEWTEAPMPVLPEGIPDYLRANVSARLQVVDGLPVEDQIVPSQSTHESLNATYYRPYQMHASIGPSAAIAQLVNGRLTVYSHSQGVEILKLALADAMNLPVDEVHVVHAEGAGCYGHNGADDVALDAALLAREVSPDPVKVQWSRDDEHTSEPYAPATLVDMRASLGADGKVASWNHESIAFSHAGRPRPAEGYSNLQSAWLLEPPKQPVPRRPAMMKEVGIHRNMEPIYDFPEQSLVKSLVADSPLWTSSVRSLGAFANVFAIESFMDELAEAAGRDPFDFRFDHLTDKRAIDVLEKLRASMPPSPMGDQSGRGIALARYKNRQTWCAIGVDAHVEEDGTPRLDRAVITADAGLIVDPDGVINQLEGGFIQAASWTLKEEVRWDVGGITTRDWETYPIIRFSEVPVIETILLDRPMEPALGVGEASTGPTPAAISNAIYAAVGIRLRSIPFTRERIREHAAGVGA